jgi:DNA repair protein SbcC/Rad50
MIPLKIKIAGFLSYQDEQEVSFGSAALWMLAGTNGSGKSSIFDGLTFALFGSHRGGNQNAGELINKESNSAIVEFEFRLDHAIYRIKRTIKRNQKGTSTGTQQIFRELSGGQWEAVPDTTKKIDFDKWIHEKIGLNYETFTSSVLLLQGKAEKLLDAKPNGRAEVLASIVDLERYQRLHARANDYKLEYKNRLEALSFQTAAVPDVSDMEYNLALLNIEGREDDRRICQTKIDELLQLESHAKSWLEAQSRHTAAQTRYSAAQALLTDAVTISTAHTRFLELRAVLPAVHTVVTTRGTLRDSEEKTKRFLKQRLEKQEDKKQSERAYELAKSQKIEAQKRLELDEKQLAVANTRLRELSAILEKARQVEEQESQLGLWRKDLQKLPANPADDHRTASETVDRLTELQRVLPVLTRFAEERTEWISEQELSAANAKKLKKATDDGQECKGRNEALRKQLDACKRDKTRAEEAVAIARTLAQQAEAALVEFTSLEGEKNCRACGQTLTPAHFALELAERKTANQTCQASLKSAEAALKKMLSEEKKLQLEFDETSTQLDKLREDYSQLNATSKQHTSSIKRLDSSLQVIYNSLAEDYQSRIADIPPTSWATTTYPTADILTGLSREVGTLPAAKKALKQAQDVLSQASLLKSKIEGAQTTIVKLRTGLGQVNTQGLREENLNLVEQETVLNKQVKATKVNLLTYDSDMDRYRSAMHACDQTLADLTGKLNTEDVNRKNCEDNIARAKRDLPETWQTLVETAGMAEASQWKSEYENHIASDVEAKYKSLEQARAGLAALEEALRLQAAEVEQFPAEVRLAPEVVREQITFARADLAAKEEAHLSALQQKAKLEHFRAQRAELNKDYLVMDAKLNQYKQLTELLGRDRLQRYLVRQAERQIVEYANGVLDRLSGGQLYLKLVTTEEASSTEKALDLEAYNRFTGGSPINVAFLSGSQKFRVAVALALAIGQYASKQHRPIESVIIDEGFGCLDRQGRQVMIQELQNLRGHLHCILLVSHQEEFADAFPDGYRFELHNGATRVSRFER